MKQRKTKELLYSTLRSQIENMSEQLYTTIIRPGIMNGCEIWVLRKAEQNLLERTEMRMLRWMMGIKRIDIKNRTNLSKGRYGKHK